MMIVDSMKVQLWVLVILIGGALPVLAQPVSYRNEVIEKWKNARAYTLEVARLMPDSGYSFKPVAEEMSFKEQLLHSASNMLWLSSAHLSKQTPPFDYKSLQQRNGLPKREIVALLEQALQYAQTAIEQLPDAELDQKVDFFAGPKTKRQIIHLMHDHLTHHRAQAIVYLRLEGITPPKYIGW